MRICEGDLKLRMVKKESLALIDNAQMQCNKSDVKMT